MTETEQLLERLVRIEGKLDRLVKVEERQNHQGNHLDKLDAQVGRHDRRLYELEKSVAVGLVQTTGRWSIVGVALDWASRLAMPVVVAFLIYSMGLKS